MHKISHVSYIEILYSLGSTTLDCIWIRLLLLIYGEYQLEPSSTTSYCVSVIHVDSFLFCTGITKWICFLTATLNWIVNYIAENIVCVWYCSFVWNKQFPLVPRWLLSCHECFFFIMQDIVYHYWWKQFLMNINGNSLLQCFGKWKCKIYIYHELRSGGNTFNAFFPPCTVLLNSRHC